MTRNASLGDAAIPGDPDAVGAVAHRLRGVSQEVANVRSSLDGDIAVEGWTGDACGAFVLTVDELPPKLRKVEDSYGMAASALDRYAVELRDLQHRSHVASRDLGEAEDEAQRQSVRRDGARRQQADAERLRDGATDPWMRSRYDAAAYEAQAEHAYATTALRAAESAATAARGRAVAAHEAWEAAVDRCRRDIDHASHAGIRNSVGTFLDRHVVHGFPGQAVEAVGLTIAAVGNGVVEIFRSAASLPERLVEFVRNPSWSSASELLGSVGSCITIVATIVGVAVLIGATGGLATPGVLVMLASVGRAASVASAAVGVAKLGVHSQMLGDGPEDGKTMSDLGWDAFDVFLGGRGLIGANAKLNSTRAMRDSIRHSQLGYLETGTYQYKSAATRTLNRMYARELGDLPGFTIGKSYSIARSAASAPFDPLSGTSVCVPPPPMCHASGGLSVIHAVPGPPLRVAPAMTPQRVVVQ